MGMRAGNGAIDRVSIRSGLIDCSVIGGGLPRGLCGSGLVDAAAAALDLAWVEPSGRMTQGRKSIALAGTVVLSQADIRELQLAKGAVAAGFDLLLEGRQLSPARVFLAGAFGNYVRGGAPRIGLLPAGDPPRMLLFGALCKEPRQPIRTPARARPWPGRACGRATSRSSHPPGHCRRRRRCRRSSTGPSPSRPP